MRNQNTIFSTFLAQVKSHEDACAIMHGTESVSYKKLLAKVDYLSGMLVQNVSPEKAKIAILLEPSINCIALMLACLKMGMAYIPLNISFPAEHIKNVLVDSQVKVLFIDSHLECSVPPGVKIISLRAYKIPDFQLPIDELEIVGSDDAYVIYTSGSTGRPKGVVIANDSVVTLIENTRAIYQIGVGDRVPLAHSLAFDFSVWEIFSTLLNGATLVIPCERELKSLDLYCSFLLKNKITILNITPALLYLLIDQLATLESKMLTSVALRLVILGGEALKPTRLKNWFALNLSRKAHIFNMYGITEGTVHSTYLKIEQAMADSSSSFIGKALPHVGLSILNDAGINVADGEVGELYLSGCSVAQGYLNHPELTKEKFFVNNEEVRSFKTGDFVRRYPDGNIEYIGRKDRGVKIRGFRVDPSAVEKALLTLETVRDTVVLARANQFAQQELIAFLVVHGEANIQEIKKILQHMLPEYMVPARLVICDQFPITVNGKVDAVRLLSGLELQSKSEVPNASVSSSEAKALLRIWERLLERDDISFDENFFDAGGNSLLLMQLHFEVQKSINAAITLMDLVEYPSINHLIDYLRTLRAPLKR